MYDRWVGLDLFTNYIWNKFIIYDIGFSTIIYNSGWIFHNRIFNMVENGPEIIQTL